MRRQKYCGVYLITNTNDGKVYVGSSFDIEARWRRHRRALKANVHVNRKLQNAWNKHGGSVFCFSVHFECEREALLSNEQRLIDQFDAFRSGYNMSAVADAPMRGRQHSIKTRQQMSRQRIGVAKSPQWRQNIAVSNKGIKKTISPEGLASLRASMKRCRSTTDQDSVTARLVAFNKSIEGRKQAARRNQKRWKDDPHYRKAVVTSNLKENWTEERVRSASERATKYNRRRSPEFNGWCARKRAAAALGKPFNEPRPEKMYLNVNQLLNPSDETQ